MMEIRGAPGGRPPGPAQSPGDTAPRPPAPAGAPGAGAPAGPPGPAPARPSTGDARVDEAVARLDDLAGLPVAEHPAVFGYVHERLTEALGDLDVRDQAGPGSQGPDAPDG
jgi:hypothetical protein